MTILKQSRTELLLRFQPWYIWIAGGTSLCLAILMSGFAYLPLAKTNSLICERQLGNSSASLDTNLDKNQGICQLKTSVLFFSQTKTFPQSQLQGVRYESIDSPQSSSQYRLVLLTQSGEIPIPQIATFHPDLQQIQLQNIAQEINSFVKDSRQTQLKVVQGDSQMGWIILTMIGVGLIWLLACGDVVTCYFDHLQGEFIQTRCWWGVFTTQSKQSLREIAGVEVQEILNPNGKNYRVSLRLKSGQKLALTPYHTNYFIGKDGTHKIADAVSKFLMDDEW